MKCPYCNEEFDIPSITRYRMITNVENYGSSNFNFRCSKCHQMVGIPVYRHVVVEDLFKSQAKNESY